MIDTQAQVDCWPDDGERRTIYLWGIKQVEEGSLVGGGPGMRDRSADAHDPRRNTGPARFPRAGIVIGVSKKKVQRAASI